MKRACAWRRVDTGGAEDAPFLYKLVLQPLTG